MVVESRSRERNQMHEDGHVLDIQGPILDLDAADFDSIPMPAQGNISPETTAIIERLTASNIPMLVPGENLMSLVGDQEVLAAKVELFGEAFAALGALEAESDDHAALTSALDLAFVLSESELTSYSHFTEANIVQLINSSTLLGEAEEPELPGGSLESARAAVDLYHESVRALCSSLANAPFQSPELVAYLELATGLQEVSLAAYQGLGVMQARETWRAGVLEPEPLAEADTAQPEDYQDIMAYDENGDPVMRRGRHVVDEPAWEQAWKANSEPLEDAARDLAEAAGTIDLNEIFRQARQYLRVVAESPEESDRLGSVADWCGMFVAASMYTGAGLDGQMRRGLYLCADVVKFFNYEPREGRIFPYIWPTGSETAFETEVYHEQIRGSKRAWLDRAALEEGLTQPGLAMDIRPGDVLLVDHSGSVQPDHITMVESYDPQTQIITTIEGNASGIRSPTVEALDDDILDDVDDGVALNERDMNRRHGAVLSIFGIGRFSVVDYEDHTYSDDAPDQMMTLDDLLRAAEEQGKTPRQFQ